MEISCVKKVEHLGSCGGSDINR